MKRCPACRCEKEGSGFSRNRTTRDGLSTYCKICDAARSRKWKSKNPEARKKTVSKWRLENREALKRSQRKCRYGVTSEQYDQMLIGQGGVCAICGQPDPRRSLSVDHNHETGEVRGLLCDRCNTGLGKFQDRADLTAKATDYLLGFTKGADV